MALRDHFSPSFLSDVFSCTMKAVLKGVLKLDATKKKSPAMLKGNILHKAMEYYFLEFKSGALKTITAPDLHKAFEKAIAYYESKAQYYDEIVLKDALKYFRGNTLLSTKLAEFLAIKFQNKINTQDNQILIELAFDKVQVSGFNFTGRVDLLFAKELIDFKTAGQGHADPIKNPDKYAAELLKLRHEYTQQLHIYDKCLEGAVDQSQITAELPEEFTIIEVILTKEPKINEYKYTKNDITKAGEELSQRVALTKKILNDKLISRNYRDTGCPCEFSQYCLDEENLKMVISKLNVPTDFF